MPCRCSTRRPSAGAAPRRKSAPAHEAPRLATTGCPYQNRCPQVMARCRTEMPPAYPVAGGGTARCFLFADNAGPTEPGAASGGAMSSRCLSVRRPGAEPVSESGDVLAGHPALRQNGR